MKRVGNIFDQIIDLENLKLAFWKASRGRRTTPGQRAFVGTLEHNLQVLREGLVEGSYPIGRYVRFKIRDPKEREICAAPFDERVLHHALMNVCEPLINRWLVPQTYACRKGFGQLRAVAAAQREARRHPWYLKCDVRKYFDSISHDVLKLTLARKFKDPFVLGWFNRIIDTYRTAPGCGLPIGNLTSQHFANLYLDRLDRFVLGLPARMAVRSLGYVRYMDDFIVWADDKSVLIEVRERIRLLLSEYLALTFKKPPTIQRTALGMDFLGMRVDRLAVHASKTRLVRFLRKRAHYERLFAEGRWDELELQRRVTSLTAVLRQGETLAWRKRHLEDFGCRRTSSGSNRVIRGGSWNNDSSNCTSYYRNNQDPSNNNNNNGDLGFRLCCSAASSLRRMIPADIQSPVSRGEIPRAVAVSSPVERCNGPFPFTTGDQGGSQNENDID